MERKRSLDSGPETGLDDGDPAEKKRLLLCVDFTTIASCETAVARRYLTENAWEMERALNAYFDPRAEEGAFPLRPETASEPGSCVDLTGEEPADPTCSGSRTPDNVQQEDGSTFSLITWNIDGLDLSNLLERAQGVCSFLALYGPDVVFLQEVVPPYYSFLRKRASNYTIITGDTEGYFTAVMLKKSRVTFKSQEIIPFPKTEMMRNLLCVHASVSGNRLCLMTSHLESTREHAQERMNQLKMVLKKMQEAPESATVIFAGDTNLRDREMGCTGTFQDLYRFSAYWMVSSSYLFPDSGGAYPRLLDLKWRPVGSHQVTQCGGLPGGVSDVWELLGRPKHCQYTWDTQANSNLGLRAVSRHRFDRIFFRAAADGGHIVPRSLDLLGLEKLDCGRFPSDHWGLLCSLDVIL